MSCVVSHRNRPFWPASIALLLFVLILTSMTLKRVDASPLPEFSQKNDSISENSTENLTESSIENSTVNDSMDNSTDNSTEISHKTDVYVIKAVVYEIGILTDSDNTTSSGSSESTERQETVDISLYNVPQEDQFP